jgi:hypothetical protein
MESVLTREECAEYVAKYMFCPVNSSLSSSFVLRNFCTNDKSSRLKEKSIWNQPAMESVPHSIQQSRTISVPGRHVRNVVSRQT